MQVIVVGAGMAGLAAADAARHSGADVVVLEARDRIGGRTWTVPLGPGSIDLGGSWVHSPVGNPIAEALAAAGISTRNDGPYYSGMAVWSDGWVEAPDRAFPAWFDFSRHVGSPTLVALYNPAATPSLAELPVELRVGRALAALRKMFGSVPEPSETLTTDWTGDPWALGSYSYVPIGATVDDMHRLGEPVSNRLLLAGEATVPASYGTVHAAFGSGLRAAARAVGKRPKRLSLGAIPPAWLDLG